MAGRNSVAIAIDARFGLGMQTISTGDYGAHNHNGHADYDNSNDGNGDAGVIGNDNRVVGEGNPRILHLPNSNALLAWAGLYGDGMGFAEEMNVLLARKVRRAGCMGFQSPSESGGTAIFGSRGKKKKMSPRAITMLMSHLLYRRRSAPYYVEPVVVGLENVRVPVSSLSMESGSLRLEGSRSKELQSIIHATTTSTNQQIIPSRREQQEAASKQIIYKTIQRPYLCGTDCLGAQSTSRSFVCSGVASRSLHGTAEALWRPGLEAEELVEVCGRAFVSALERDCLSGYGAVVYLIHGGKEEEGGNEDDVRIIEYVLACRND